METLLLPIASSPDPPEGFPLQDAPQGFGNFAEVLAKQYFKEENPLPEDQKVLPEEATYFPLTNSSLAAIRLPNEIGFFIQGEPIPEDQKVLPEEATYFPLTNSSPAAIRGPNETGFFIQGEPIPAPAAKEGCPAPPPTELSSLFIIPQPFLGSESGAIAASMNGGNPVSLPDEMPSLSVPPVQEKGASTQPVFLHSGNGETNQEMSPTDEKNPGKPVPGISSLSSSSSGDQKAGPTLQGSLIPPDSSIAQTSSEDFLQRQLGGNMEIAPQEERKTTHPVDSSTSPISLEEVLLQEPTAKMDMPSESGQKFVRFSDSPTSPISLKESAEKMQVSVGGERNFIRPSTPQESNGNEKRPVQETNDFLAGSQPSLEMEANSRIGQGQGLKKQGPLFGAAKEAAGPEIPQNLQERGPLVGNQAYILDSTDRESGTLFSANAGKGQEKVLWAGPDIRPLAAREVQSPPSFFAALTNPLNCQVENGGEIKEASAPLSERPDPQALFQQVGQRVLWLVRNNEERIRITLEPPELGQVFLEIDRHKEHIKTILWTDNPTTKASLETSQGEIQRIIESEGFKLEKFNVFVQQDPGWFQGRKENPRKADSWEVRMPAEEKGSSANSTESIPGRTPAPHLASRYLNLLV